MSTLGRRSGYAFHPEASTGSASDGDVEADLGLGPDGVRHVGRALLGNDQIASQIASVKNDLEANPSQKFDLARKVRVFNSFIEFVELEVLGTEVSRRTVTIPSHLLAVADARTREQLHATFRLVPAHDKLSGEAIDKDRKLLTKRFLHVIPRYGTVVLRRDKEAFESGIKDLEAAVAQFAQAVREEIQRAIDKNREELVKSLLPALSPGSTNGIPYSRVRLKDRYGNTVRWVDAYASGRFSFFPRRALQRRMRGAVEQLLAARAEDAEIYRPVETTTDVR